MLETAKQTSIFSILSNLLLSGIKFLAGYFGNSFALIADAIESASDVIASVLVFFGIRYASRPADEDHPYGHGRIEPLITFIVVGLLVASSLFIGYRGIIQIRNPDGLKPEWYTLVVLGAIIIWKEVSFRIVDKRGDTTGSSSLKADAWHHRSDAITSLAALIGIAVVLIFGEQYAAADDWAALVAAVFILYNAYAIFKPAFQEVMDENIYEEVILEVRRIAAGVEGVRGTEKCIVRKAGMMYHIDLHALVDGNLTVTEGHNIAHRIIDRLNAEIPNAGHINIHIEPESYHFRVEA